MRLDRVVKLISGLKNEFYFLRYVMISKNFFLAQSFSELTRNAVLIPEPGSRNSFLNCFVTYKSVCVELCF